MANKGRNIHSGELSLWQKMTQGIKAWHKEEEMADINMPETSKGKPLTNNSNRLGAPPQQPNGPPKLPRQQNLDKRTQEKLSKGKMPIEAVLDLHGMTQAQAHARLVSFVTMAHGSGKRCVLVITGKGSRETNDAGIVSERVGARGVLRQRLPEWLMQTPLNHIVLKHAKAAHKHGGSGAFYIYLRKAV